MNVQFPITKITGGDCNQYPFPNPMVPPGSSYSLTGPLGTLTPAIFGYSPGEDYLSHISGGFSGIAVRFRENGKLYQPPYGGDFPDGVGIGTWERTSTGITVTLNGTCPGFIWGCGYPGTYPFTWVTTGTNVIPAEIPCGNLT
jgi:hypothetical protein